MQKNKKMEKINMYKTKENNKYKNAKISIILIVILLLLILIIINFIKNNNNKVKNLKIGNNSTSQEIIDYILNIKSYQTEIEIEVKSNKNSNKYKMKQTYINNENSTQEILEPQNIQGIKIIKEGNNLRIENSRLGLNKIIENYREITQNNLDLNVFIEDYKNNSNSTFKEENNQIIMETTASNGNNYLKYKKLFVSKENGKPLKMEIKDTNQNVIIYIKYNEIEINKKDTILTHSDIGSEGHDNKKRRYVLC